jgi:O-acetyl-ADP-ribose deacetylase (regulator of RNase III)
VAAELGCRTVAIPAISTGVYGYPVERAAGVAVAATREALAGHSAVERVSFVLFEEQTRRVYAAAIDA